VPEVHLARLRGFEGWGVAKHLIHRGTTPVGRHHTGVAEAGWAAVIFGGGCAGRANFSRSNSSFSSGSGCVSRVSVSSRASVVGTCTSIICTAQNFSSTLRGGQARGEILEPMTQRHVQAVGEKGDENMRFNTPLFLMKDWPDRQIAFECFERLFDRHQPQIILPEFGGIGLGEIGP
jgi:hypothetical protein